MYTANGAFYATSANGAGKFGILPIAQGGTGSSSAAGALSALGLTATAIRMDGINVAKKVFNEDDTIQGLSIFDAIEQGILSKPDYVCADLEPEETIKSIEKSLNKLSQNKRNIVTDKLKVIKNTDFNECKLENIIPRHSNGSKKYIVFTPNIEDCEEWTKRFKHILHTDKVYAIHSKTPKGYNKAKMDYFNNYEGKDNIAIVGVDMITEGLHIQEGTSRNARLYRMHRGM